jgi:hypothetical protein
VARYSEIASRMVLGVVMVFAWGCGYHFAASGTGLPANAQTIYVKTFSNTSQVTGLNDEFTLYLKQEIANHKRLEVVDSPQAADLTLSGGISLETTFPLTFNSVSEPTQYSEMITIAAALEDNHTDKVIWSNNHITNMGAFPIVSQAVISTAPSFLQGNLRRQDIAQLPDMQVAAVEQHLTQQQMLQNLARSLYNSMSDGF